MTATMIGFLAFLWKESTRSTITLITVYVAAMKSLRHKKQPPSPQVNRQEALRCVPLVNSSVWSGELESGEIPLEFPLQMKPLFHSIFRRFGNSLEIPTKKLQLDEMGSCVWKKINGENTVQDIIISFALQYSITRQEAEKSVTTFLADLGRRGIIALR